MTKSVFVFANVFVSGGKKKMTKGKENIMDKYDNFEKETLMLPLELAFHIAEAAHRNQYRVNGDYYFSHPLRMLDYYEDLLFKHLNPYKIETLKDNNIPVEGIREIILLHDVIEDTIITHKDIKDTFYKNNLKEYFDNYISVPLKLITHNKKDKYETYIKKVMSNPVSALVKMIDLINNLDLLRLDKFEKKEYKRAIKYINAFKTINDKYHYVENIFNYLQDIR